MFKLKEMPETKANIIKLKFFCANLFCEAMGKKGTNPWVSEGKQVHRGASLLKNPVKCYYRISGITLAKVGWSPIYDCPNGT